MEFNLTSELVEQVIFAMEDQQHEYYIHRYSGELLRQDEIAGDVKQEDPLVSIPPGESFP